MSKIIIEVITESVKESQSENWVWTWDLVIKAVGLLTIVATFITSLIGASKYFFEKNRDVHLRRLNEVYAPLFSYLVKQEAFRKIVFPDLKVKEFPIISLVKVKSTSKINMKTGEPTKVEYKETEEQLGILDRSKFIKLFNETNKGLARPKLLGLINKYEILIYLEENLPHRKDRDSPGMKDSGYYEDDDPRWIHATEEKVEIENQIFNEIISGYYETLKKLEIDKNSIIKNTKDLFI